MAGQRAQESEEQKELRGKASSHLFQSLGILVFLGLVKIAINGYLYMNISNEVEALSLAEPDVAEDLDWLITALKVIYGMFILIGVGFLVCAATSFLFPMTSTITALGAICHQRNCGACDGPLGFAQYSRVDDSRSHFWWFGYRPLITPPIISLSKVVAEAEP